MPIKTSTMYKCLFCYGSTKCFQQNENHLSLQRIITSCNNHLTREFAVGIDWKSVNSVSGTFCKECYIIVEKLVSLTDHLDRILLQIKELDSNLVSRVSRERKINELSQSTFYNVGGVRGSNNFDICAPKIEVTENWNLETSASETNDRFHRNERSLIHGNSTADPEFRTEFPEESNSCNNYDANTSPETGDQEDESETLSRNVDTNKDKRKSPKKKTKPNLKKDSAAPKQKMVVTSSDLLRHSKSGALGYECDKCHKRFSRLAILNRHDCSSPTIECEVCKISFSGSGVLKLHMRSHTGEKPFKCETCGKCFSIKQHMMIHMRMHTGERPFNCEICQKTFREQGHYSKHMATHSKTEEKMYKCDTCFKSFTSQQSLKNHLLHHKADRPYKCPCGKSYAVKNKLRQHQILVNYHSGENPFKCDICEKGFASQFSLNSHVRSHSEKVLCEECGKSFANNEYLAIHILTHTEKGHFICETCGKNYPSSVRLNQHILRYHSDKSIKCKKCGKIFQSQPLLLKHQKDLECEGPPFKCTECDKTFGKKIARDRHKILEHVSENERPTFPCKECPKIFHLREDFSNHMGKKHRRSRDPSLASCEPCEICKKPFKNQQNLELHKQLCTTKCSDCPRQFSSKCEYTVHRQESHVKRKRGVLCKTCNRPVHPKLFQTHLKSCPGPPVESPDNADNAESSNFFYSMAGLPRKCKLKSAKNVFHSGGENNESDESDSGSEEMYQAENDEEVKIKEEEDYTMAHSEVKTEYGDYDEIHHQMNEYN